MISAKEIRSTFLEFFRMKGHTIVPSAPIVVKNDPTLMFTNAGMNQFKDYFLGNKKAPYNRAADTQKCLRVSGKHNDLEEVGVDHYHHTMFEMLGNWSFGDYFKKEAIEWSWELLTDVYKIDKNRLYVTVFEGDAKEGLAFDQEAYDCWAKLIDPARILKGNKKDNFWEMGDTGPCGPCSEIHVDMRADDERKAIGGDTLVNNDHPEVIEIWNNVFMEFNRKADNTLEKLPAQHVDTGMGFERLTRVLQGKISNYDTDIFQPLIGKISQITKIQYKNTGSVEDIAFRVIADHIRAVAFCIADGQLPSNNGAGYVIRRILRRALRYGYSYLNMKNAFMYDLVPVLSKEFGSVFPEISLQEDFITKVIQEEENSFLKTLAGGIHLLTKEISQIKELRRKVSQDIKNELRAFLSENNIPYEIVKKTINEKQTNYIIIHDIALSISYEKKEKAYHKSTQTLTIPNKGPQELIWINLRPSLFFDKNLQKHFSEQIKQLPFYNFIKSFDSNISEIKNEISGKTAFELYDTFGFPIDLTQLIASDNHFSVDIPKFEKLLLEQKARSRKDAEKETGDWKNYVLKLEGGKYHMTGNDITMTISRNEPFIGYDKLEADAKILRNRTVKIKDKDQYQLVFNTTPFYAESGGQVGDTGVMIGKTNGEKISVLDTQKENDLIIHIVNKLPEDSDQVFEVKVDEEKRKLTTNNHTATHLLQAALKQVLGNHIAQKGSLVNPGHLRFDFSHFAKVSEGELSAIEQIVNDKIAENIELDEQRNVPIKQAVEELGATALFGEKYGELVRVITFGKDYSVELCGGTHVKNTGVIRRFKITSESSVAAGVRRIEAITSKEADNYFNTIENQLKSIQHLMGDPANLEAAILKLNNEKAELQKKLETIETQKAGEIKAVLKSKIVTDKNGLNTLFERVDNLSAEHLKNICFQLRNEVENLFGVIVSLVNDKPMVTVFCTDELVKSKQINCGNIIRELAKSIDGGGGGQPFFATAGGKNVNGLYEALEKGRALQFS